MDEGAKLVYRERTLKGVKRYECASERCVLPGETTWENCAKTPLLESKHGHRELHGREILMALLEHHLRLLYAARVRKGIRERFVYMRFARMGRSRLVDKIRQLAPILYACYDRRRMFPRDSREVNAGPVVEELENWVQQSTTPDPEVGGKQDPRYVELKTLMDNVILLEGVIKSSAVPVPGDAVDSSVQGTSRQFTTPGALKELSIPLLRDPSLETPKSSGGTVALKRASLTQGVITESSSTKKSKTKEKGKVSATRKCLDFI